MKLNWATKSLEVTLEGFKALPLSTTSLKQSLAAQIPAETSLSAMSEDDLRQFMQPDDSDYVYVPTRALSAAEVQNKCINFAHNDGKALKEAVALFNGLIVLKDHHMVVDNWIGKTQDAFWDTETPGAPPGVTLVMKVDAKADPKCARGLVTGMLDSVSVTVAFEFEPSHPDMKEYDFYMRLGEVVDGKTVQALVTKVTRLYELSVVWQGADVYARTIADDGSINTPGLSSNSAHIPKEDTVKFAALIARFGLAIADPDKATDEQVTEALEAHITALTTQLDASKTQLTAATAEVTAKDTQIQTLQAKTTELDTVLETAKTNAALGEQFLNNTRAEALRLYNVVEGDKATEALRTLINTANLEVAQSFVTSYAPKAEAMAPLHCTKCGCSELSRKQSTTPTPGANNQTALKQADPRIAEACKRIH